MLLYQIYQRPTDLESMVSAFANDKTWLLVVLAACLMPLNLGFEMKKWKEIHIHSLTWKQTIKAVLGGMSIGLLTPNKIGEYGGRVWFLPKETRQAGVASTMMGNWAQLFTTICFGSIGLTVLGWSGGVDEIILPKSLMRFSFVFIPIATFCYFKSEKLIQVFEGYSWAKRLSGFFETFRILDSQKWWIAFFLVGSQICCFCCSIVVASFCILSRFRLGLSLVNSILLFYTNFYTHNCCGRVRRPRVLTSCAVFP